MQIAAQAMVRNPWHLKNVAAASSEEMLMYAMNFHNLYMSSYTMECKRISPRQQTHTKIPNTIL